MSWSEEIAADGLRLVQLTADQASALQSGEPVDVVAGQGWPHADTLDGISFALAAGGHGVLPWLIVWTEDGSEVVVGDLGVKGPPDPDGEVEIGYGLAAPYRRRGIGTAAVAAFTDWLLDQPDVRSVVAATEITNVASRRLLERVGFRLARVDDSEAWYARDATRP